MYHSQHASHVRRCTKAGSPLDNHARLYETWDSTRQPCVNVSTIHVSDSAQSLKCRLIIIRRYSYSTTTCGSWQSHVSMFDNHVAWTGEVTKRRLLEKLECISCPRQRETAKQIVTEISTPRNGQQKTSAPKTMERQHEGHLQSAINTDSILRLISPLRTVINQISVQLYLNASRRKLILDI